MPPGRKVLPELREPKDIKGSKALPAQRVVLAVLVPRDFKVSPGLREGQALKVPWVAQAHRDRKATRAQASPARRVVRAQLVGQAHRAQPVGPARKARAVLKARPARSVLRALKA